MKKETIEHMMGNVDEQYIAEAIKAAEDKQVNGKQAGSGMKWKKVATAAAISLLVLGTGFSVAAATSDAIRSWLTKNFLGYEVTEVEVGLDNGKRKDTEEIKKQEEVVDIPVDQNNQLSMKDDMFILGEKESFVCQYHFEGDDEVVDQVYSIQGQGLKKLEPQIFRGDYDGEEFSFEYVIIHQEICGFNTKGVNEVFHYMDGDKVYVDLVQIKEDTYEKGCIAECNLKTGSVTKLTNDQAIGNMIMSPNGKVILINYRADGYWTAFDIASRTEKRIDEINGYAHTKEVIFQDDYHVLTYGDDYMVGDVTMTGTKVIDLKTGKRVATYQQCGDYNPEWVYSQEDQQLKITHVDGTEAITIEQVEGYPHPIASQGDFVLLGNLEEEKTPYYLCNLKEKIYMKMDPLDGVGVDIDINLAAKEKLMLIYDGEKAYLVDISKMHG